MAEIRQLAEGEAPADPNQYLLIERVREPSGTTQYRVTARGYDIEELKSGEFKHPTPEQARLWALKLADDLNVAVIYEIT